MNLELEPYLQQRERWPAAGRHILAQHDDQGIVVYQAYSKLIGSHAAEHGHFGGSWSFSRQTWIKPNFLWMQHRSGWGTKEDQVVTLAVKLCWDGFRTLLGAAVHSSFQPQLYGNEVGWRRELAASPVRLQWDPDHRPDGQKEARRALQLGIGWPLTQRYARDWIVSLEDISAFVAEQREHALGRAWDKLLTPREQVVKLADAALERRLELDSSEGN